MYYYCTTHMQNVVLGVAQRLSVTRW